MSEKKLTGRDPLYELFEHFLFNRSFEDSSAFTKEVAEEYLAYLDATPAHVPFQSRAGVLKDLEAEAHEMLIKKMYGCTKNSAYKSYGKVMTVTRKQELEAYECSNDDDSPQSVKK